MATIKQIRANRSNAQKSTGPQSPEAKERVRFNALVHGLRAESIVIPGEDQAKFDQHLARLSAAWLPQDDMEKSLVEDIAVTQWKLASIDRNDSTIKHQAVPSGEYALALHRIYHTQTRLQRAISSTIADLQRYRKERTERLKDAKDKTPEKIKMGLLWLNPKGASHYAVLPRVLGLDGTWREIPRELLGDFPEPTPDGDPTA